MLRAPGVYKPQTDTELLLQAALAEELPVNAEVLDLCTGTARVAIGLAQSRPVQMTAVDVSRRAVWAARLNARRQETPVEVRHGDLFQPVADRRFDLILANPPYVPSPRAGVPHTAGVAWNAGADGRDLVNRICAQAAEHLTPTGVLLIVHSGLCLPRQTAQDLQRRGLSAGVVDRAFIPFGPVMRSRAAWLVREGLIDPDQGTEEVVVIRAQRALAATPVVTADSAHGDPAANETPRAVDAV